MTGRAAGFCAAYGMPGSMNPAFGRGMGMGLGRGVMSRGFGGGGGRGRRNMFYATGVPGWMRFGNPPTAFAKADPEREKQALKSQADYMQSELNSIRRQLEELEKADRAK